MPIGLYWCLALLVPVGSSVVPAGHRILATMPGNDLLGSASVTRILTGPLVSIPGLHILYSLRILSTLDDMARSAPVG